jgi:hypothetical protein
VTTAAHTPVPTLAVGETWLVDDASHERLVRQLARLPRGLAGVAAATGPLPPGSSFRVEAEHRACDPLDVATEHVRGPVRAALLRPEVEFTLGAAGVDTRDHELLLDPGAHVHDPWAAPGELAAADPRGRPPFPWRPVVMFLGTAPEPERAEWARTLVNGLVRADVEARLALPLVAEGLHLTRPCLPDEASLVTLAPDVVVALDPGARELAGAAATVNRSMVLVEPLEDVAATWELVSWRRGRTSGRLRARIGPRIDAATLAGLVRRLCAGPHPLTPAEATGGPVRTWTPGVERRGPRWSRTPAHTMAIVTGERRPGERVEGLVEHLSACGVTVEVVPAGTKADDAVRAADVALLDTRARSDAAVALIGRAAPGHAVVVDLGPADLAGDGPPSEATLAPAAARLARGATAVLAGAPAVHRAALAADVRSIVVPTLMPRSRFLALRRLRTRHERSTAPVLAWSVGERARRPVVAAVAAALLELLAASPDLQVDVAGDHDAPPRELLDHRRVTTVRDPDADRLAAWRAHAWTPGAVDAEIASDLRPLADAGCAGVPTVVAARLRPSLEGPYARELLVDDEKAVGDWVGRLRPLLDDQQVWEQRSAAAARTADALHGPAAAEAVANRFLGWIALAAP